MAALPGLPRLRLPHEPPFLPITNPELRLHILRGYTPDFTGALFYRASCVFRTVIPRAFAISVGYALDLTFSTIVIILINGHLVEITDHSMLNNY